MKKDICSHKNIDVPVAIPHYNTIMEFWSLKLIVPSPSNYTNGYNCNQNEVSVYFFLFSLSESFCAVFLQ